MRISKYIFVDAKRGRFKRLHWTDLVKLAIIVLKTIWIGHLNCRAWYFNISKQSKKGHGGFKGSGRVGSLTKI